MSNKIGFIQGRLSPMIDNKIQAFPWGNWQEEFFLARENNFQLIEWTLDQSDLYLNPIMTNEGRLEIKKLSYKYNVKIPSLTGDCFMQSPFWKASESDKAVLEQDFINVCDASSKLDISFIVVPLVDNGTIENESQEDYLVTFLMDHASKFQLNNQQIIFESDFDPGRLHEFIQRFDSRNFGINYDVGNSAALGYNVDDEFNAYGKNIMNVHIKDRKYNGITVPLGQGDANFDKVFKNLSKFSYQGNLILQTARALDDNHIEPLVKYRNMTKEWMNCFAI